MSGGISQMMMFFRFSENTPRKLPRFPFLPRVSPKAGKVFGRRVIDATIAYRSGNAVEGLDRIKPLGKVEGLAAVPLTFE
jgi:hypothetical protein